MRRGAEPGTAVESSTANTKDNGPILQVKGLRVAFHSRTGSVTAVDGIDLDIRRGEVMGLVGESGSGKSVTALAIMRLIQMPGLVEAGEVLFAGTDILKLSPREMRNLRGNRLAMIFQQPLSSLNPVMRLGDQVSEVLTVHKRTKAARSRQRTIELLDLVGIPDPHRIASAYPHEVSGGMAQRVMIAIALACEPEILIADEPTTALDVTIQAQILDLIRQLQREFRTAILLITHDFGVVAEMCDRVAVMYAGEIVERAEVRALYQHPMHPYTQGLIGSIPDHTVLRDELSVIPGAVPSPGSWGPACRFAPRCNARVTHDVANAELLHPELTFVAPGHEVRCWLYSSDRGEPAS
jgi:oligopeptide/dipeptide ABC transporter ATP-binding protein